MMNIKLQNSGMSEMSDKHTTRKKNAYGIVAGFRLLLWWGTEVARQVLVYKKPMAQVIHVTKSHRNLPASAWAFDEEKSYCLVSDQQNTRVEIHTVSLMKKN